MFTLIVYKHHSGNSASTRHHFRSRTLSLWLDLLPKIHQPQLPFNFQSNKLNSFSQLQASNYKNVFNFEVITKSSEVPEIREPGLKVIGEMLSDEEVFVKKMVHCCVLYESLKKRCQNVFEDSSNQSKHSLARNATKNGTVKVINNWKLNLFFFNFMHISFQPTCPFTLHELESCESSLHYSVFKNLSILFTDHTFQAVQPPDNSYHHDPSTNKYSKLSIKNQLQLDNWIDSITTSQKTLLNATFKDKYEKSSVFSTTILIGLIFLIMNITVFAATFAQWYFVRKKLRNRDTESLKVNKKLFWSGQEMSDYVAGNNPLVLSASNYHITSNKKLHQKNSKDNERCNNDEAYQFEANKSARLELCNYEDNTNKRDISKNNYGNNEDITFLNKSLSKGNNDNNNSNKNISCMSKGSFASKTFTNENISRHESHRQFYTPTLDNINFIGMNDDRIKNEKMLHDSKDYSSGMIKEYKFDTQLIEKNKSSMFPNPTIHNNNYHIAPNIETKASQAKGINDKYAGIRMTYGNGINTALPSSSLEPILLDQQLPILNSCFLPPQQNTHQQFNLQQSTNTPSIPNTHPLRSSTSSNHIDDVATKVKFEDNSQSKQNQLVWESTIFSKLHEKSLSQAQNNERAGVGSNSHVNTSTVV